MADATQIAQVRSNIGDTVRETVEQLIGDGSTTLFALKYRNVQNLVVTIGGNVVTPDMVYAGAGQFILPTAPAEDAKITVSYEYSGFTDAVLGSLLDTNQSVALATRAALVDLLASAARRTDYQQGQTKVSASQLFKNLKELFNMYMPGGELSDEGGVSVGNRSHQNPTSLETRQDLSRSDNFSDNNVG
jgi:hypothetical protein